MIEIGQQILEVGWLITKLVFMLLLLSLGVMFLVALFGGKKK